MDFAWSEEQLGYKNAAIRFAQKELSQGVVASDRQETFCPERWRKCANFGVLDLPFAEAYSGADEDILTTMLVMEGLGYGGKDNGLLFALNAQMWAVQHPISHFGTAEQKARYLPSLIRGEIIGAQGISEPESGSDAFAMRARAERYEGGYRLNIHGGYGYTTEFEVERDLRDAIGGTLYSALIKKAFPNTPCIFVYRDPVEVIVSILRETWAFDWSINRRQLWIEPIVKSFTEKDVEKLNYEEYYCIILASFLRMALEMSKQDLLLLNYKQLPDAIWTSIPDHFQILFSESEKAQLRNSAQYYSKSVHKNILFHDDSSNKKQEATTLLTLMVDKWLTEPYERLEEIRRTRIPEFSA